LEPTKIYVKSVISVLRTNLIKGFAHITGGGLTENILRILPKNLGVTLDAKKWNVLPIFGWLATIGISSMNLYISISKNRKMYKVIYINVDRDICYFIFTGGINKDEMLRTFNCGIGAVLICSEENKTEVLTKLSSLSVEDENPVVIGSVNTYCGNSARL